MRNTHFAIMKRDQVANMFGAMTVRSDCSDSCIASELKVVLICCHQAIALIECKSRLTIVAEFEGVASS